MPPNSPTYKFHCRHPTRCAILGYLSPNYHSRSASCVANVRDNGGSCVLFDTWPPPVGLGWGLMCQTRHAKVGQRTLNAGFRTAIAGSTEISTCHAQGNAHSTAHSAHCTTTFSSFELLRSPHIFQIRRAKRRSNIKVKSNRTQRSHVFIPHLPRHRVGHR